MFNSQLSLKAFGFRKPRSLKLRASEGSRRWSLRRAVLGVEVRNTSLYLASIQPGLRGEQIVGTGVISNFAELKAEELHQRLNDFLGPLGGEVPIVALGLSRREVILRLLNLPQVSRKSVEEALTLQVELFKPTDNERFCWDASCITKDKQLSTSLVLAPRATIERLANLFAGAGYPISYFTLIQFAILDLYLRGQAQQPTERLILLDAKGPEVELAFLEGDRLVHSRAIDLPSGDSLSEQATVAEIQRAVSTLHWHQGAPASISISGCVPESVKGVLERLGPVNHFETRLWSERFCADTGQEISIGAVAVALAGLHRNRASYRLNLLPPELRPSRRSLQRVPTYALLAANALLLVALGLRTPIQDYVLLHQYRNEIISLKPRADEMKAVLEKNRALRQRLILLEEFKKSGRQPIDALSEVAQRLPQEAWLNAFVWRKGQIELMGSAKSASTLLPLLEASPQFSEVKFNGALTQDSSGLERFRLQMRMKEKQ